MNRYYIYFILSNLIKSTFSTYSMIIQELPPTPSKFHYIFNLRDLSRIYNGLCRTTPERFSTTEQFLRVWRNECVRVIGDRLINEQDKKFIDVCSASEHSSLFPFLSHVGSFFEKKIFLEPGLTSEILFLWQD